MWRVSTAPVDASASMGVNRKKFWLLINVTCTGKSPAQRRANSTAAVTPANPPPRITMRGASEVDGRASTRPAVAALIPGDVAGMVASGMAPSDPRGVGRATMLPRFGRRREPDHAPDASHEEILIPELTHGRCLRLRLSRSAKRAASTAKGALGHLRSSDFLLR